MIYITGDTHGEQARFSPFGMPREESFRANDTDIVCGDFGYIFSGSDEENKFLDELSEKPYTICFCDGNHDNLPAIYAYPEEEWNGGRVHRIRKNIFHLMRGQIFEIEGKKFFTMGGAFSIDKEYRTEGLSWWKEELPNGDEYAEATKNLREAGNKVDYIITHTAPRSIISRMGEHSDPRDSELTGFLDWVVDEIRFKRWFFGHWHQEGEIGTKFRALWFDVEKI